MKLTKNKIKKMILDHNSKSRYPLPKYLLFCFSMIEEGYIVELVRSKSTVSKYVYITYKEKLIKVRFSNHKPTKYKQDINDSDFYVGVSNYGCITTEELIPLVKNIFKEVK